MKAEVEAALAQAANFRREVLSNLSRADRRRLLEELLGDFFVGQWRSLLKWAALTGQSSQVDTGYLAQHVASLLLGEPGQGFKGKGVDLLDGTEVKSAATISGVDRPRWNHNLGKIADDAKRREQGKATVGEEYLAIPTIVYLLFDQVVGQTEFVQRIRVWAVDAQADDAWRSVVTTFLETRPASRYNLQLHPPVGYDDSLVINTIGGNLDLSEVKVMEARIHGAAGAGDFYVEWVQYPPDQVRPIHGRSTAIPYVRDKERVSRLSEAADVMPDLAILQELLPNVPPGVLEKMLTAAVAAEEAEDDDVEAGPLDDVN